MYPNDKFAIWQKYVENTTSAMSKLDFRVGDSEIRPRAGLEN